VIVTPNYLENVMEYLKCQFDNPDGMQFCGKCGGKLGEEVQSESATAVPKLEDVHARLQRSMPKSLAAQIQADTSDIEGENRILSILFTDVSGPVALAENMAPEDSADPINECLRAMVDTILKYGGIITATWVTAYWRSLIYLKLMRVIRREPFQRRWR
jgi:hypothetical protein